MELSAAVEADLAFHRSNWYMPAGRTPGCYQDWTVAMAYHGAVYLTDRHTAHTSAIAAANRRASAMQRRCSRLLAKYGLTTQIGTKTPAADLYYAAVAVLVDAGKATKWIRRRDLRRGWAHDPNSALVAHRDPYWELKLKCTCLWLPSPPPRARKPRPRPIDPHSGLPVTAQLEVLRCTRAIGVDSMPMPEWGVHRDHGELESVAEKMRHTNPPVATKLQAWIVILVDIASGRMTTDDAIPDDATLLSMRHGSSTLPPHVGGLSDEQCEVLSAVREGASMWRDWPAREHGVAPCDSRYRVVEQEVTQSWDCAVRWKLIAFTQPEGEMACERITFRAENPRGSRRWLRLKEFVRRARLDPALWGQFTSSRCHGGGSERKTALHATDSQERTTIGCFECGVDHTGRNDRGCSLFYPPLTRGDGEHEHDVAAYRRRPDTTAEHLHYLDPQPQLALIIADHANTTEQQRARMVNVDICAGSQSQRRGNALVNIRTESFDERTSVTAAGGRVVTNNYIDASSDDPSMYDVVRSALHSQQVAMSRVNVVTLSSDCATNCTSAASDSRDARGRPLPGTEGNVARTAGKVVLSTLRFLHRARAERDYLLSTMD